MYLLPISSQRDEYIKKDVPSLRSDTKSGKGGSNFDEVECEISTRQGSERSEVKNREMEMMGMERRRLCRRSALVPFE
jgi:hypothetical protein